MIAGDADALFQPWDDNCGGGLHPLIFNSLVNRGDVGAGAKAVLFPFAKKTTEQIRMAKLNGCKESEKYDSVLFHLNQQIPKTPLDFKPKIEEWPGGHPRSSRRRHLQPSGGTLLGCGVIESASI